MLKQEYKAELLEIALKTKCFCKLVTDGIDTPVVYDKCIILKFEWVGMKNTYDIIFEAYGVETVRFSCNTHDIKDIILLNEVSAIQLQSVGRAQGLPAKRLVVGDRLMWNFGSIYIVRSISPSKTGKTITIIEESERTGERFERKLSVNRSVALADRVTGKFYSIG